MIILRPTNLHWIDGSLDDPKDHCAHGSVDFQIDGHPLLSSVHCTVSAAALFLLRTLSQPHTKSQPVGGWLFPCCGNGIFEVEGKEDVLVLGCNSGFEFEVVHQENEVHITTEDETQYRANIAQWTNAVCAFADAVRAFYTSSSPKEFEDEFEQQSFRKFMAEWSRRRSLAGTNPFADPLDKY